MGPSGLSGTLHAGMVAETSHFGWVYAAKHVTQAATFSHTLPVAIFIAGQDHRPQTVALSDPGESDYKLKAHI